MSEVMIACNGRNGSRWQLLATASAAALLVFLGVSNEGRAADDDAAPFWIELGGQFAQQDIKQENYFACIRAGDAAAAVYYCVADRCPKAAAVKLGWLTEDRLRTGGNGLGFLSCRPVRQKQQKQNFKPANGACEPHELLCL